MNGNTWLVTDDSSLLITMMMTVRIRRLEMKTNIKMLVIMTKMKIVTMTMMTMMP